MSLFNLRIVFRANKQPPFEISINLHKHCEIPMTSHRYLAISSAKPNLLIIPFYLLEVTNIDVFSIPVCGEFHK